MKVHAVTIRYGPYLSCATVQHREERLQGLVTTLSEEGHTVMLEKVPHRNVIQLVVHEKVVFQCNIQVQFFQHIYMIVR